MIGSVTYRKFLHTLDAKYLFSQYGYVTHATCFIIGSIENFRGETSLMSLQNLLEVGEDRPNMFFVRCAHIGTIKERFVGKKKQYTFVVNVERSDGTLITVWRSYRDFFYFQCDLLDAFPQEAGAMRGTVRLIPYLPGMHVIPTI